VFTTQTHPAHPPKNTPDPVRHDHPSPNADLNVAIAAAVIGCFGPEFFDSFGLLRSAWLERLQAVPDETLALIDQWCQPGTAPSATQSTARWRRD
jgi:hypothetical protein